MIIPGMVSVTFRQLSVAEVVELVAETGLQAIEWGGDVHVPLGDTAAAESTAALCRKAGIAIASYGSYFRAGATEQVEFDTVLRTAVALGAPSIRVWAGTTGSAATDADGRTEVVDSLRACADDAAEHGILIALEYHRNTLTDTLASATRLLAEVDRSEVVPYWQPTGGQDTEVALTEIGALLPDLTTAHLFSWGADGYTDRLPLADRADLWRPVLSALGADGVDRYALLEFVRDDDPEVFRADAATLLSWLAA